MEKQADTVKILILLMSCNQEYFINQSNIMKQSLNQQIKKYNLNDSIKVYDYVGESEELCIIDDTIHCTSMDKMTGTYLKTIECLNYINKNIEYDYIFRTNTSTFINVYLLYQIISNIKDPSIIYTGDLYCIQEFCPTPFDMMPRGNGIILSKENVNIILNNKYNFVDNEKYSNAGTGFDNSVFVDDVCLATVLNIYFLEKGLSQTEIYEKYRTYYHGWLNCYNGTSMFRPISNGLCNWENINISYEFLKQFTTIQIKSYDKGIRHMDNDKIRLLTTIFMNNTYDKKKSKYIVKKNMEHYKEQLYYIGWKYVRPYIDKNELMINYNNYIANQSS